MPHYKLQQRYILGNTDINFNNQTQCTLGEMSTLVIPPTMPKRLSKQLIPGRRQEGKREMLKMSIIWDLKSTIFWNITPCSPLSVSEKHIASIFRVEEIKSPSTCFHAGFLLNLFCRPWRWRLYVPPKRLLTFNGLHGVIFQKTVLFMTTAVRTSNPTYEFFHYILPFTQFVNGINIPHVFPTTCFGLIGPSSGMF
jgi:hypothetical protein